MSELLKRASEALAKARIDCKRMAYNERALRKMRDEEHKRADRMRDIVSELFELLDLTGPDYDRKPAAMLAGAVKKLVYDRDRLSKAFRVKKAVLNQLFAALRGCGPTDKDILGAVQKLIQADNDKACEVNRLRTDLSDAEANHQRDLEYSPAAAKGDAFVVGQVQAALEDAGVTEGNGLAGRIRNLAAERDELRNWKVAHQGDAAVLANTTSTLNEALAQCRRLSSTMEANDDT